MADIQEQLKELYSALHQQRIVTYANAAALAWVGYDILLTSSQELKVIWRGKPSLAKFFYLVSRYYSLAMLVLITVVSTNTGNLSENFCKSYIKVYASAPIAGSYAVDALLIIRLYALYNKNKSLLGVLLVLYFGGLATSSTISVIALRSTQFIPKPFNLPYPGCLVTIPQEIDKSVAAWTISLFTQLYSFYPNLYVPRPEHIQRRGRVVPKRHYTSSGETDP